MNDRLRFRVWDKRLNRYLGEYDPIQMIMSNGNLAYLDDYGMKFYEVEQCTGLKDRNGNFIYENDIVKLSSDREVVCPVVWDNEETGFCVKYKKELYRFNTYKKYHIIEVCGNIHENKELLKWVKI